MTQLATTLAFTEAPGEDTFDVRVSDRRMVGEDIVSLTLRRADGQPFPAWEPGAHIDVFLGEDGDGEPLSRQYSLWGPVEDYKAWRIGILKDPKSKGGSERVHSQLLDGVALQVRGPRNHFRLEPAESYVFIAGGIGITPILPMVRQAERQGIPWKLFYLARNRARLALLEEIDGLPERNVTLHCDEENGMIDLAGITSALGVSDHVYACGPGPLLDVLDGMSVDSGRWTFHCERFAAAPVAPGRIDLPFDVVLAKSGTSHHIPAGVSCLKVLREAGMDVDWSCSEGVCGTCETEVLEGEPEHRDSVLTEEERASNETMMICVSRARSARIVLDL
ncbi:PDR/VanB family oxidoreductase [Paenarthrobacter sp. PH39-S1]|uniref:PDR/VanB family oxidoreductase n=1 Tax=Paenarthrobacter sp. PH39-S1 TaxID=3046204 RepID=UPI0024B89FCC|nr:PDR/VanB family oxidoreductase [Paenarthrobacter sp. PH39-S1]MDJ0358255.1 PDR/VanB family oxidoreductase [Paenarthrobacter sp. PH39-S1]